MTATRISVQRHPEGCILAVRVQPGARRDELVGNRNGALKVALTARPEKGKANKALIDLLHKRLGLKRSALQIVTGQTSRGKRILVRGVDPATLQQRLDALSFVRQAAGDR